MLLKFVMMMMMMMAMRSLRGRQTRRFFGFHVADPSSPACSFLDDTRESLCVAERCILAAVQHWMLLLLFFFAP
jgi:hypothetical protein